MGLLAFYAVVSLKWFLFYCFRFFSFDEENVQFCCENIAAHLEHTLEWEREMVIKRQQEVRSTRNVNILGG